MAESIEIEEDGEYCDTCKTYEPIYKLCCFKQFHGFHCLNCFQLIDEDDDEENEENYIITISMIRVLHQVSYKNQRYYHKLCMEIIKK